MKNVLLMVLVLVMSTQAFAKKNYGNIKMATGGPKGSYFTMGNNINEYCGSSTGGMIAVLNSGGSEENIKGLTGKTFAAGIVQEDVLRYYAKKDEGTFNQNNMRVIAGLHMEAVHLLLPIGYSPDNGMFGNMMAKMSKPASVDITLLKDQTVAAWGGSVLSAKALSMFIGLNLNVVGTSAKAAASSGHPLIIVAGRDSATVKAVLKSGRYELVGINPAAVGSAQFYKPMNISYQSGNVTTEVTTIGVRALLLGKVKSKKKYNKRMNQLASCIEDSFEEFNDDDETHVNWQGAWTLHEQAGRINWGYFDNDVNYEGKEADDEDDE